MRIARDYAEVDAIQRREWARMTARKRVEMGLAATYNAWRAVRNPDLPPPTTMLKVVRLFNEYGVRFLVGGAYAVMHNARIVRSTNDLDLWVDPTPENAERIIKALERIGRGATHYRAEDIYAKHIMLVVGKEPDKVEISTSIEGVKDFAEAWRTRSRGKLFGVTDIDVYYVSLAHMIATKRAIQGRRRKGGKAEADAADLHNLLEEQQRRERRRGGE